jgi:hypothetical protein
MSARKPTTWPIVMLTLTVVAAFFLGIALLGPEAATKKGALSKMDNTRVDIADPAR